MSAPMPAFTKAPAELVEAFTDAMRGLEGAEQRKMFGYPSAFVGGQLFTGLFRSSWFVRLPEAQREELTRLGGSPFDPMPGRPMKEYVVLPEAIRADPGALRSWLERSFAYATSLPPKSGRRR